MDKPAEEVEPLQEEVVFQRLAATVEYAGLMAARPGPYAWLALLLAALFCAAAYCAYQVTLQSGGKLSLNAAG